MPAKLPLHKAYLFFRLLHSILQLQQLMAQLHRMPLRMCCMRLHIELLLMPPELHLQRTITLLQRNTILPREPDKSVHQHHLLLLHQLPNELRTMQ
jgi:hypothetical protein